MIMQIRPAFIRLGSFIFATFAVVEYKSKCFLSLFSPPPPPFFFLRQRSVDAEGRWDASADESVGGKLAKASRQGVRF